MSKKGKSLADVRREMLAETWGFEVDLDRPFDGLDKAIDAAKDRLWDAIAAEVARQTTDAMLDLVKDLQTDHGYILLPNGNICLTPDVLNPVTEPFHGVHIGNLRTVLRAAAFNETSIVSDRYLIDTAAFLEKLAADMRKWAENPLRNPMRAECDEPLK